MCWANVFLLIFFFISIDNLLMCPQMGYIWLLSVLKVALTDLRQAHAIFVNYCYCLMTPDFVTCCSLQHFIWATRMLKQWRWSKKSKAKFTAEYIFDYNHLKAEDYHLSYCGVNKKKKKPGATSQRHSIAETPWACSYRLILPTLCLHMLQFWHWFGTLLSGAIFGYFVKYLSACLCI